MMKSICSTLLAMTGSVLVAETIPISQLDTSAVTCGWGSAQVNQSVNRHTMKIGGKTFKEGLGVHAPSKGVFELEDCATLFEATVGVDDEEHGGGTVEFKVWGDDRLLWSSGVMRGNAAPRTKDVKVDVSKVHFLTLEVTDADGNRDCDHADWANARFTFKDSRGLAAVTRQLGILTPKTSDRPRINGATVYGVRPGHPVIYRVPVTGEAPLEVKVEGLEKARGLSFDPVTRALTGSVAQAGDYELVVKARNAKGSAERKFVIRVGETIALTPAMGWNSWNCFGVGVNAEKVKAAADAMVSSGLSDHGWQYINIDDFWQNSAQHGKNDATLRGPARAADGTIVSNKRFPDMKGLADYVHAKGLKIGLYSSPGPLTCGSCTGSWQHEDQDAATYAAWGFDFLKYDWCSYGGVAMGNGLQRAMYPYLKMGRALRMQNRDILFSLCQYGMDGVSRWGALAGGQSWRTTGDVFDNWRSISGAINMQKQHWYFTQPGAWNDPDMLCVGKMAWNGYNGSRLTPNEQYTHISLWALIASPLMIGCDMTKLDDFTFSLLANDEVIEIDQDPLGKGAARVAEGKGWEVWARPLADGSVAMGLYNRLLREREIPVNLTALGLEGAWKVRDCWRQADEGVKTGSYCASVPGHATHLIRLSPAGGKLRAGLTDVREAAWKLEMEAFRPIEPENNGFVPTSFKDAAKIKSWDAWSDHKKPSAWKEKRSVTREKILKMDSGLEPSGVLETRAAKDIKASDWSVGCETLDRDYADWDQYKRFLADLGAKHGRLFSGWAKTEQKKGVYDFAWLDPQVREMAAMGVKPWICISYGNPVWGSDFRLGMRVRQVTGNRAAFDAWLRYTKALVARYKDVVNEWEIWNEPFNQANEYAEMVYETAKAIHEVQPDAVCLVTAITMKDYSVVLEKLKRENALGLVKKWVYHPYVHNPDTNYETLALPLRKLVKSYSSDYDIVQGEVGCPSQLEYAHAICNVEWTEYSQAKWDLRRAIGDRVRNIPSNLFTLIDLQYTFMLQSFGLIRSNTLKQPVYRRPSYFAMQNVYSYFDENVHSVDFRKAQVNGKELSVAQFSFQSAPVYVVWFSGERPGDSLAYERGDLSAIVKFWKAQQKELAWCDLMTGKICKLPDLKSVPLWDSPVMITLSRLLPRKTVWQEMTPAQIVDALYRPGQTMGNVKMDISKEPWTKMATKDFLPCFDQYGQFKWREWPGKVHSDAELKAATEREEKDLAAHPGLSGWDKFGGWQGGPQLKATGRFRTEKVNGKWWLVDPEGRLFWSWGPVRVTPSSAMTPLNGNPRTPKCGGSLPDRDCLFAALPKKGDPLAAFYETYDDLLRPFYLKRDETRWYDFSSANLYRKYGADWFAKYSASCHRRLRSWHCNTIANSSDLRICLQDRTPYAERVECLSRPIAGSWGNWFKFRDPFDVSFKAGCKAELERHGREAHDPWCIGFFIDNEINWGGKPTDLAQWTLWSPDDQPAKIEFARRLRAKGIDIKKDAVPEEELKAFTAAIVEEYFKRTREAVKEFDAGLLYLGCRFAGVGSAKPWVIGACAKYADVVSYNIYGNGIRDFRIAGGYDAPVLIGEFHFGAHDRGLFGSGLSNKGSQAGRAKALRDYVDSALANPLVVGVHWHQFSDQATSGRFDGEYFQVGWTDICDQPYAETIDALRTIDVYAGRNK